LVRALSEGTATVQVSARGVVATASIAVAVDNGTLTVSPTGASLWVDATQQFTATLLNRHGDTLAATPQWTSSNSGAATVDQNGLVRAVGTGSATIQATVGPKTASAAVTVGPRPASVTLVGAGDIASCTSGGDEATAKLLDSIPGTIFTAGDNAYEDGSAENYSSCYAPSWGRHKGRTRPAPGNHEYFTPGATGYFGYFGSAAGEAGKGYYSYDLGAWHVVMLNSSLNVGAGSPEEVWLRADLAASSARCTIAIWHHPRFSSGPHGSSTIMQSIWQTLYDAGADVVVTGHDHMYERFAPQNAAGQLDLARGIRQFVVGTGGAAAYAVMSPAANSEVRNSGTRGVLKLTLYPDRYEWKFVPVKGSSFTDSGTASCH
jgi:acid phosphatase type 7